MATRLQDVAATADDVAVEQRTVARRLRAMDRQRAKGRSWLQIVDDGGEVLGILRDSGRRLVGATGQLAATLARGLAGEGESRRGIAARLGISHQRVTTLLRNGRHQ